MNIIRTAAYVAFILISALTASAAGGASPADSTSRPVTGIYSIELGGRSALSTYLSPITYHGMSVGVSGLWTKALARDPERLTMTFDAYLEGARMLNPAHNSIMIDFGGRAGWNLSRRWRMPAGVQLTAGGDIEAGAGLLYLLRNGNNPVAARADISLGLTGSASYRMKIGRLPVLVSDRVRIPSLSVFFSPGYGETYYEIYLGNHSGLAHCGWWGNHFMLDNLLAFDLDFGRTAMRIGYRFSAATSWINSINTHLFTHAFVIGVIPGGLGMKKKKPESINALY